MALVSPYLPPREAIAPEPIRLDLLTPRRRLLALCDSPEYRDQIQPDLWPRIQAIRECAPDATDAVRDVIRYAPPALLLAWAAETQA